MKESVNKSIPESLAKSPSASSRGTPGEAKGSTNKQTPNQKQGQSPIPKSLVTKPSETSKSSAVAEVETKLEEAAPAAEMDSSAEPTAEDRGSTPTEEPKVDEAEEVSVQEQNMVAIIDASNDSKEVIISSNESCQNTIAKFCLGRHIRGVHQKKKDIKCPLCDYAAAKMGTLDGQINAIHHKIKPFQCTQCEYNISHVALG